VLIDRHLDGHDVLLRLGHVGNKQSVPRLIGAFERAGATMEDEGSCVADHSLDALRSLTGHDAGKTAVAWQSWWEETGSRLPESEFHPRESGTRGRSASPALFASPSEPNGEPR
jgi:hypothetical protein